MSGDKTAPRNLLHSIKCSECLPFNRNLAKQILYLEHRSTTKRTHYFAGRYENIYLPIDELSDISFIIDTALKSGARILGCNKKDLSLGFWLNIMRKGDVTQIHTHDDDDELLSGTYYIKVPDNHSKLILNLDGEAKEIEPEEGKFVFFHPATPHEVTVNHSSEPRISIGFNMGSKKSKQDLYGDSNR